MILVLPRLTRVEFDDQVRFHLHRIRHISQFRNAIDAALEGAFINGGIQECHARQKPCLLQQECHGTFLKLNSIADRVIRDGMLQR